MNSQEILKQTKISRLMLNLYLIKIKSIWFFTKNIDKTFKRLLDISVSLLVLTLLFPLLVIVAIIIKTSDKGSVLFWQKRVGIRGKTFMFPKFRSMYSGSEKQKSALLKMNSHKNSITFKMKNDPRITPFGKTIRKYSVDELPQLWSVLKGDMSLVGPRPATVDEVALYSLKDRKRLNITPGITCIWQVSGRGDIPFEKQVELDVEYIKSQSFFKDIKILLLTIPAVLSGRGAY